MIAGDYVRWLQALPETPASALLGDRTLVVVAPHPDDESLGCGGLIAWAAAQGRTVELVYLTNGERSHPGSRRYPPKRLGHLRQTEARAAAASLGVPASRLHFLGLPDSGLDGLGPAARRQAQRQLEHILGNQFPLACVTARTDPHADHQAAWHLAAAAAQALDVPLLSYPVWTWRLPADEDIAIPATAGWRVDISTQQPRKRAAIAAYASQAGDLITDATDPFRLPDALLRRAHAPHEVFLDERL